MEQEIRALWHLAYPKTETDEMDVFFDEIFAPDATFVARKDKDMVACAQWQERKMMFVGQTLNIGVVRGLLVSPEMKAAERNAKIGEVLQQIHRNQYEKGVHFSLIVPRDAKERQCLEQFGYITATYRLTADVKMPPFFAPDEKVKVTEEMEWGRDLWLFYAQNGGIHEMEMKMTEEDFYALLEMHDLAGGSVYAARRHNKVVGIALARREGKPLKSGKPSTKQFRMNVSYILASDESVLRNLHYYILERGKCSQIVMTGGCPAKGFANVQPYAMVRAINAEKFLTTVARRLPGLQLVVCLDGDKDIPENNVHYRLRDGRCFVNTTVADSVVGPGGIPAMLLSGQPVLIP